MSVASPALPARTERFWAALLAATLMNLPLGIGLLLQRAPAANRAGAGDPALGAVAGLRSGDGGIHGGLGRRRLPLPVGPRADPGAGERAGGRRRHRHSGDGERAFAIAAGLRRRVRHRRRRGLHPAAAGREHAGAAAPGAGERLHRQPLPDGRDDRDACLPCLQRGLRLAHHPGWPGDRAGGLRDRGGAARPPRRGAAGRAGRAVPRQRRKKGRRSWVPPS